MGPTGREILWGACTDFEVAERFSTGYTIPRPAYQGVGHYDESAGTVDGELYVAQAPILVEAMRTGPSTFLTSSMVNGRWTYFGRDFGPKFDPFLYYTDINGIPTSHTVKAIGANEAPGATIIDIDDDWVMAAGDAAPDAPFWQWRCGDPIDKPVVLGATDQAASWSTFTPDLEPVCGGYLGITTVDSLGRMDAVLDEEGGVVVVTSLRDSLTLWEGLPEEQTFTADGTDVLIVRLAPP
jgi:hypothetical protein